KPIDSTRDLFVGQEVDVGPASGGAGRIMRVLSVDEAFVYLTMLKMETKEPPAWRAGTEFAFSMWREDDAVYRWHTKLDRMEEMPRRWAFDHVHHLDREQKREHYRVRYDETV